MGALNNTSFVNASVEGGLIFDYFFYKNIALTTSVAGAYCYRYRPVNTVLNRPTPALHTVQKKCAINAKALAAKKLITNHYAHLMGNFNMPIGATSDYLDYGFGGRFDYSFDLVWPWLHPYVQISYAREQGKVDAATTDFYSFQGGLLYRWIIIDQIHLSPYFAAGPLIGTVGNGQTFTNAGAELGVIFDYYFVRNVSISTAVAASVAIDKQVQAPFLQAYMGVGYRTTSDRQVVDRDKDEKPEDADFLEHYFQVWGDFSLPIAKGTDFVKPGLGVKAAYSRRLWADWFYPIVSGGLKYHPGQQDNLKTVFLYGHAGVFIPHQGHARAAHNPVRCPRGRLLAMLMVRTLSTPAQMPGQSSTGTFLIT